MDIAKMKAEVEEMDKVLSDPYYEQEEEEQVNNAEEEETEQEATDETEQEASSEAETEQETEQETTSETKEEEETKTETKTETEEEEEDELTRYKREVEELRTQINELSAKKESKTESETETETKTKTEQETKPKSEKAKEQNFMEGIDFDEVTSDPNEFNKLLNKIYEQAVNDARESASENILRSIPDIVRTNISTVANLKAASEKFYQDNPDLQPFKGAVAAVFEEIASENPDKEFSELLGTVAEESRRRLSLQKKASTPPADKTNTNKPPKLPKKRGRQNRSQSPDTSGIESELAEMDKVLNS